MTIHLAGKPYTLGDLLAISRQAVGMDATAARLHLCRPDPLACWLAVLAALLNDSELILGGSPRNTAKSTADGSDFSKSLTRIAKEPLGKPACPNDLQRLAERLSSPLPKLALATSGTTGEPTLVWKSWQVIAAEAQQLSRFYALNESGSASNSAGQLVSLVSPIHIYGLIHSLMLPLLTGCSAVQVADVSLGCCPAEQSALAKQPCRLLVTTPASWPRAKEILSQQQVPVLVSSAGAFGAERQQELVATLAEKADGIRAMEIYGSTETGGLAWQDLIKRDGFRPFAGVSIDHAGGEPIAKSPFIYPKGVAKLQDQLEPMGERFQVLGRRDKVFKYGGVRHSLSAVAKELAKAANVPEELVVCDFQQASHLPKGGVLWGFVQLPTVDDGLKERYLAEQRDKGRRLPFPDAIRAVAELPRSALGKVSLAELRRRHRGD